MNTKNWSYRTTAFSENNNPKEFEDLSEFQKDVLMSWIDQCLKPYQTKGYYPHYSSYGLKHQFELSDHGFYISNGAFKGAMKEARLDPKNEKALNWIFKLGKRAGENNKSFIPVI